MFSASISALARRLRQHHERGALHRGARLADAGPDAAELALCRGALRCFTGRCLAACGIGIELSGTGLGFAALDWPDRADRCPWYRGGSGGKCPPVPNSPVVAAVERLAALPWQCRQGKPLSNPRVKQHVGPIGSVCLHVPFDLEPEHLDPAMPCSNPTSTVASMRRYGVLFRKLRTAECIAQKYGPPATRDQANAMARFSHCGSTPAMARIDSSSSAVHARP